MIASRISVASLALALVAFGALAQSEDDRATAPPRQLGVPSMEQAPDAPSEGLTDDQEPSPTEKPSARRSDEEPPDVSTDGLLDDNEDVPAKTPAAKPNFLPPVSAEPMAPIIPKPEKVEVNTLGTIDGSVVGLLDSRNGGFESNMWSGSSRDEIERLLTKAPLASPDSAVRSLTRRVVLSRAEAPPGSFKRSLVTIRIEKLLGAGMVDDAGALAAAAEVKDDADFARVRANALLYSGRDKDVCGEKTSARLSESDLFWLQLRIYCAAVSGDTATADITRNVVDAQGQTDAAFNVLLENVLTSAKRPTGKIAKPTAMHVFLLRKASMSIPPEVSAPLGVAASVLTMRDTHNLPETRLSAAERVVKAGAARIAELKAVVDAQNIPANELADALAAAPKLSFLKAQVALRRAAQLETRPAAKAALIHEALVLGDKAGLFEIAADLQAEAAATLKTDGISQNQKPLIGWALLIAGKSAAAAPWLGDNDVARAVLGLALGKDDMAQAALSNIATRLTTGTDKAYSAARPMEALLLGSYDALGYALPADAKAEALAIRAQRLPGRRPDDATMQKLLQAAAVADRKGEAILRILEILGPKGPGDLAPDVTLEVVRALEEMGVKDAAHAIALHALLLYRPGTS